MYLRILKFARVDAQVAVGGGEQFLEIVEAERFIRRQGADNAQAHALVNQPVKVLAAASRRPAGARRATSRPFAGFQRMTPAERIWI